MGKVLKQISQGGQNKVIGQKEDKDLEELPYINDLTTSFLCSSSLRRMPTSFSPGVYLCLPSCLTDPLCAFPVVVLCLQKVPAFIVFASMRNAFFTRGKKSQGKIASNL